MVSDSTSQESNVRASHYFIAQTADYCWKCRGGTRLFAFIVPEDHESLENDWELVPEPAFLQYVESIPKSVEQSITAITSLYKLGYSDTLKQSYWMNHCEKCGVGQGDDKLFDIEDAFHPINEKQARAITLREIKQPFEAHVGGMFFTPLVDQMSRV